MGGEPDKDGWLTAQVAALHGYLVDLSEPDLLDQADELSALIPAIVAQPHQDGDTVLALETANWLAPLDSMALLGATRNLLDRATSLLRERLAYALADHLPLVEADQAEPPALDHPQHWWLARGRHPPDNRIVGPTLRLINNPHRARSAPQLRHAVQQSVLPPGRVLSATPRADHRQAGKPPVASPTMSTP